MDQFQSTPLVTYDPIRQFPYDIWTECIKFAMGDDYAGPLPYLAVSRHWCQALIETPSLWTTIVTKEGADGAARIHTFLHLSQNSLLDVIFLSSVDTLLAILEANASRIRSISLHRMRLESEEALFAINHSLPTLQVLDAGARFIPSNFLLRCPNLLTVISALFDVEDLHLLNPAIQDVNFSAITLDNIHRILPHSNYRSLGMDIEADSMPNSVEYVDLRWSATLESLSTHLGTCLERLSITVSPTLLPALILYVPLLHRLHTLNLTISLSFRVEPDEVVFAEGIQQVRNTNLTFHSTGERTYDSKALDMTLEAFHKARFFQNLEEIDIFSDVECSASQLGPCLQSAWNVRKITINTDLHHETPEKLTSKSSPMIRLESLTINCLPILDYIDAANPIFLQLVRKNKSYTVRERKFKFHVAKCEDNDMLKRLDPVDQGELLHGCHIMIFQGSFQIHPTMVFSGLTDVDLSGDYVEMFDFLGGILQNPEICPRLHTIRMDRFPFWELLFTVMRQRLAANVTSIRMFVIPGLPCAYLLSHLTRLLKGDSVFTANDVDVIISKRHRDLAFEACSGCIEAGYMHCDDSGIYKYQFTSIDPSSQDLNFLPDNPGGPHQTWEGWKDLNNSDYYWNPNRKHYCDRNGAGDTRIKITEHTSNGWSFVEHRHD